MIFTLKCCGKKDPLGVDKQNIRLSFALSGSLEITRYELQLRYASGEAVCSISGKSGDGFTHWIAPELWQDQTQYCWRLAAETADGKKLLSPEGRFETGISRWQAQWIGGATQDGRTLEFQRSICLDAPVKKARLYICGLGYFTPFFNGKKLDDSWFIPPVTDYTYREAVDPVHRGTNHRISYYTYDVTALLRQGENILLAEVAGGYFSNQEKLNFEPQPDYSFGEPCLRYELHMEDDAGNMRIVCSDDKTLVRCTNTASNLYSGECVDFTRAQMPWSAAHTVKAPDGRMTAPECEADKVQKILAPVKSWQTPEGTVYDFGVNHTGGLTMTAFAEKPARLTIRFAEVLHSDGTLNFETAAWHGQHIHTQENKHIYQQNTYFLREGKQEIAPRFSWFCYRYALVCHEKDVRLEDMRSLFIHMDTEKNGAFSCSEELLNRINDMFLQTLRCNMHSGMMMDCPHRERLPYTGDGKLVMQSACYNLDTIPFYYKWLQDILDAQTAEGLIPNSAPYLGGGGGYAWGNALCAVSQYLYRYTGDLQIAYKSYDAIVKWLGYYQSKCDENYIIRSNSHTWMLGDWLAPEVVCSNVYYISTVCYLQAVKTALFFAELMDKENCQKWEDLENKIKAGINRVFFNKEKLTYGNGVQGENMLALAEDIVPAAYREKMEQELRHHYSVETDYHLDTGIVLTPVLINYLTDHGCADIAWRIMTAKTYPSYFSLMEGDTTFSEHWSKKWPDYYFGEPGNSRLVKGGGDLSHCHPMFGSVAAWLYEKVAGLDISLLWQKKILVTPYFTHCLQWAKADKETACGAVSVQWQWQQEEFSLELTVPQGLTAQCCFPASCDCLTEAHTNQKFVPEADGFFRFALPAGQWQLTGCKTLCKA